MILFCFKLNADLAKALDAKVVAGSTADIRNPTETLEKIETQEYVLFAVQTCTRAAQVYCMQTKGLPESADSSAGNT